ncbi:substrate-binding periplasmic protein [Alishewanella tabrizica]|uniref:Amino acid ABC transporter substrate-binding protein n=1 Tax=Alishewanella tabrizica TaxID=671278 RepID=A0ABQ2WGM2_9ALTE|nr:transporter substrate-binding domain-containing protein [Alishewanella tabrizica]GGW55405.1 amino acid ABC transporter substrate-binding protein [Alishewanella tabrizica]
MRSLPLFLTLTFCSSLFILLSSCKPVTEQPISPNATTSTLPTTPTEPCTLKVGFDAWEPYHYLAPGQQATGLDIDILQALATELGCELTLQQDTWSVLLSKLQQGEIDLLPGASRSQERENYSWFSDPYRQEQFVLYTRGDATLDFTDLASLLAAGHKVGLVNDYYYGADIDALYDSNPQGFVNAQIAELNLARLLDEEISAVLEDNYVATAILRRKGLDRTIKALPITLAPSDVHLMLSKASVNEAKLAEVNSAIERLKQNGTLQKLLQPYQQ